MVTVAVADEARANLGEAISLILEDRREDVLRGTLGSAGG